MLSKNLTFDESAYKLLKNAIVEIFLISKSQRNRRKTYYTPGQTPKILSVILSDPIIRNTSIVKMLFSTLS